MKLRHRVYRWLGVVDPSGAYPLPPRWDMSKVGQSRWYPLVDDTPRYVHAAGCVPAPSGSPWACCSCQAVEMLRQPGAGHWTDDAGC